MPVRNAELWVAETIESLIAQSFKDWELVVVDDGSVDSTYDVLSYYAAKLGDQMHGHIFADSQGIAVCRNKATELARGEIICVQDADDLSQKDRLKETWAYFKRHKKVDLIYGACQYIDWKGQPFRMVPAEPFDFERLRTHNYIQHPTVAYRRAAALKVPYRKECRVLDDWFLYYDFHKAGLKIAPLEQVLAFYRVLMTSVSRSEAKSKEVAEMREKFLKEAANG